MNHLPANGSGAEDPVTWVPIDEAQPETVVLAYTMQPPPDSSPPLQSNSPGERVVWPAATVLAGTLHDLRKFPSKLASFTLSQANPVARLTFSDPAEPTTPHATFMLRWVPPWDWRALPLDDPNALPPDDPSRASPPHVRAPVEWALWCSVPVDENVFVKRRLALLWFEPRPWFELLPHRTE
jgi:hypothetical protein